MKVLAISLLRIGDLLMASAAIQGLKNKYPGCELHLLINRECESARDLLKFVDKFHFFERSQIQSSLGEVERNIFEGYDRIKDLTTRLSENKYDLIINFSQTRLSGYLMSAIRAPDKVGLEMMDQTLARFGVPWFRYLNTWMGTRYRGVFHYSDICTFGAGVNTDNNRIRLSSTDSGWRPKPDCKNIFIQPFSADAKKEWSFESWATALSYLSRTIPNSHFFILGSPAEKVKSEDLNALLQERSVSSEVLILTFSELCFALKSADALFTLDTSIKHLAASSGCPIVELALGSSDVQFTGAHQKDSLIISGVTECFPCNHSSPCSQSTHRCADSLNPNLVGSAFEHFLNKNWSALSVMAYDYQNSIQLSRTRLTQDSIWWLEKLNSNQKTKLSHILDKWAWKYVLNQLHHGVLASYGSEALKVSQYMKNNGIDRNDLTAIELDAVHLERTLYSLNVVMQKSVKAQRFDECLQLIFTSDLDESIKVCIRDFTSTYGDVGLYAFRQIQNLMSDLQAHIQVKIKTIKALSQQIPEVFI